MRQKVTEKATEKMCLVEFSTRNLSCALSILSGRRRTAAAAESPHITSVRSKCRDDEFIISE